MVEIRGISASPGIIWGKAFVYIEDALTIPKYDIGPAWIVNELKRFQDAIEKAESEVRALLTEARAKGFSQSTEILNSHLVMLRDPQFFAEVEERMRVELKNIDWVAYQAFREYSDRLAAMEDQVFRERATDIRDVGHRVLGHLVHRRKVSLTEISGRVILVGRDLMPSETVALNPAIVRGLAMEEGGRTSHTAILARSFEIPAVLGLKDLTKLVQTGDEILIDGNQGVVVINPDAATRRLYEKSRRIWVRREENLHRFASLPAETRDGKLISVFGNIEVPDEVEALKFFGAEGIGLYRSEFLFIQPGRLPSEDVQVSAYAQVLEAMEGRDVTIRTLDLGGDKMIPDLSDTSEKNPLLGWRAIRFCLSERQIFKTQLRALYRASIHGKLKIMFPLITTIEEYYAALDICGEVRNELRGRQIPFDENVSVGCMIEIPAAAAAADILAKDAGFFSIGTNDLIQYTLGVDRGNQRVAYLYDSFHPAVLRLIRNTIACAHAEGIRVCMCGEMAGDPFATLFLLGLGLDEFSMHGSSIPEVKKIIRSVSFAEAQDFAGELMRMTSGREIYGFIKRHMEKRFDLAVYSERS
ncbi:MAG: phosphoenolpyruvate--protein phosphotransferase [Spirochaetales bacterium]|jgi:phosphotransferase system enzyme I (PtsI)|nr:phosphoenolpyruvate--protein phosphotransferase [Spirochaetales bacterium]